MKIKLSKIGIAENPVVETANKDEYQYGNHNDKSVPLEYEIVGLIRDMPKIGYPISGIRLERNGESIPGVFCLSNVKDIETLEKKDVFIIKTLNSVYLMQILEKDEKTLASSENV